VLKSRAVAAMLACSTLAGCDTALLQPAGRIGIAEKSILIDSMAIMLTIVIPTIVLTLAVAWWFRRSNKRATRMPDFVYSGRVELVVWSIPLMTIMLLGGVAWIGAHTLDPAERLDSTNPPLEVQGVSLDWKWLFIYPGEHVAAVNQLFIPAGRPVHFSLTSGSVMNAFFVPQLGSMIYTMDGMVSQLNLIADQPGVYYGESSHYSGDGFSDMNFQVHAIPQDQFAAWAQSTRGHGPALDDEGYKQLSRQSLHVAPFTYGDVGATMFRDIVSQTLPQGPGPEETGMPKANVSPQSHEMPAGQH
jgi:cytochrome o ubiquinol oxidase subunit 2